jgi:PIN domain nuclease of toxin-antitoxin system
MKIGYLDSSGLLAMILLEPGSTKVAERIQGFDRFFSSNLLEAEIRSALRREPDLGYNACDRVRCVLRYQRNWRRGNEEDCVWPSEPGGSP